MDFWAVPEMWDRLLDWFQVSDREEVLKKLHIDMRLVAPGYTGPRMETFADGSFMEPMGTHRRLAHNAYSTYSELASAPMGSFTSPEQVYAYPYAQPDWWDFAGLAGRIGRLHDEYYIKIETGGMYENAWALRGYEQLLLDMYDAPMIVHAIMDYLCTFYCEFVKRAMECAGGLIDMVYTYDDIAAQNALILSRDMIEEFILPYHRRLNGLIKSYGKSIMFHSCGAIFPMIGDLVELPIDVLNPLQPRAQGMDFERIKTLYGDRISFHGGICIQKTLPYGTQEDVRRAVRHAIDTLGKDGGYILTSAHYIQADTPVDNVIAMFDEGWRYRATTV